MDPLLERAILLVDRRVWCSRVTNSARVFEIIDTGHVHITTMPDFPDYWRTAYVTTPEGKPHTIQLFWQGESDYTCHCYTCQGTCDAAVAAFCVNIVDLFENQRKEDACEFCGQSIVRHEHPPVKQRGNDRRASVSHREDLIPET